MSYCTPVRQSRRDDLPGDQTWRCDLAADIAVSWIALQIARNGRPTCDADDLVSMASLGR